MSTKKIVKITALFVLTAVLLCGCAKKNYSSKVTVNTNTPTENDDPNQPIVAPTVNVPTYTINSSYDKYFKFGTNIVELDEQGDTPVAIMKLEDKGYISVILYPRNAPNAVNNFISRIANGEYDGVSFYGFDSTLGLVSSVTTEEYTLAKETPDAPILRRAEYVLFMNKDVLTGNNVSGSSFFICLDSAYQNDFDNHLFKDYVAIGEIMDGVEVLWNIALKCKGATTKFEQPITVEQFVVDLNGYTIKETSKLK